MHANQQPEDLAKVGPERQPWTEAWEQAWEAYQAQQKPGGDEKVASLRNRAGGVVFRWHSKSFVLFALDPLKNAAAHLGFSGRQPFYRTRLSA
jgi:hypothetical protein